MHRDVKPANVMLVGDGVKLLDFGIARSPNDTRLTGNLTVGTPLCMAPEQIRGRGAVPESDIYALGCILFWCLTGHAPYEGRDIADIFEAHLGDRPPPLDVPGLPPAIAEFCHACLEKNPSFRPDAVRAVGVLFPGEPPTAVIGAVKGGDRRNRRRTAGFATVTLGHVKAGLTTGRFGTARTGAPGTAAQRPSPAAPAASSADAASTRVKGQEQGQGSGQTRPDADVDTVPLGFGRNRRRLVPVLAVSLPFAAASITAVILLTGTPGGGTAMPLGAPALPGPQNQTSQPSAEHASPSASGTSRRAPAPVISRRASGPAVSPSVSASATSTSTPAPAAAPIGDPIQYLDSVRQQITDMVAQGPATMDATTGGDLQNSIADIQNSITTAQQNGGAAHLQEVRDKIAAFDANLSGLVSQGRVSSAAANQLTGEMNRLSAALTD